MASARFSWLTCCALLAAALPVAVTTRVVDEKPAREQCPERPKAQAQRGPIRTEALRLVATTGLDIRESQAERPDPGTSPEFSLLLPEPPRYPVSVEPACESAGYRPMARCWWIGRSPHAPPVLS